MKSVENRTVLENLHSSYENLSVSEKRIADFIFSNPDQAVKYNVSELANASQTSDATVIRFCKHSGYSGYYQLRITLSRELGRIDQVQQPDPKEGTAALALQKFAANILEISRQTDEMKFQECAKLLANCHYVHIVAAGNTTPLAHHVGFRLGRLGIRSTFHMLSEYFFNDIFLAQEDDVILAISQSGTSVQVVKALELAAQKHIPSIAVVGYEYSPVSKLATYLLPAIVPDQIFDYRKNHGHIYEMAVLDALMDVIANNQNQTNTDLPDQQEMLLSDSKL